MYTGEKLTKIMLETKNIHIKKNGKILVNNLSFVADDGQIICLTGDNHVASLLLRVFIGLERINSGFVSIEGELLTPSSATEFRKDMAYLPAPPPMTDGTMEETAKQIFNLQANANKKLTTENLTEEMRLLGLNETLLQKPDAQLTEQERLLMLLALTGCIGKKIIIVDNPTKGLDSIRTNTVVQYLRSKADNGATIIVATNDKQMLNDAEKIINATGITETRR